MKERVLIAIPSGTGRPDVDCMASLNSTILDLQENDRERPDVRFIHGNCYIALIRNLFAHEFIHKSDCSHLFFWDDDVAAPPSALRRLLDHDRDIIVGPYPKKVPAGTPPENAWPVRLASGIPDAYGLLESEMVATGFLLIKRRVIEKLYEIHAESKFYHKEYKEEVVDLFPTGILPGFPGDDRGRKLWWGEDYSFSVLAQRAGFKIWLDPNITLIHAGRNVWRGQFWRNADGAKPAASTSSAA